MPLPGVRNEQSAEGQADLEVEEEPAEKKELIEQRRQIKHLRQSQLTSELRSWQNSNRTLRSVRGENRSHHPSIQGSRTGLTTCGVCVTSIRREVKLTRKKRASWQHKQKRRLTEKCEEARVRRDQINKLRVKSDGRRNREASFGSQAAGAAGQLTGCYPNGCPEPERFVSNYHKLEAGAQENWKIVCFNIDGATANAQGSTTQEETRQPPISRSTLFLMVAGILTQISTQTSCILFHEEDLKVLGYTHNSTPLKHSTSPLHHPRSHTHARLGAQLLSHPGLSTRVGPGGTPAVHPYSLCGGGRGWLTITRTRHDKNTLCYESQHGRGAGRGNNRSRSVDRPGR